MNPSGSIGDEMKNGLTLVTGNRLETLSQALAEVTHLPLSNPFDKEIIIVQSSGMARWVSLQLSTYLGISANTDFLFPNAFIYKVLKSISGENSNGEVFEPGALTWKIEAVMPGLLQQSEFSTLRNYISGSEQALKQFQLSEKIADTFDQYLLFRPDMIAGWERGKDNHWQAQLWREIIKNEKPLHRVNLFSSFKQYIESGKIPGNDFPERVSVFGISALPQFHMEMLELVSRVTRVTLFLLNPCSEFWGEIVSDREEIRAKRNNSEAGGVLYLEQGNALLASMGALGREFFDMVQSFQCQEIQAFDPPGENTLLSRIQSGMLTLFDHRNQPTLLTEASDDSSVELHSCHSPMRETEVLNDSLYRMFDEDRTLTPGDIVVMAPDIEVYAPFIRAVFDRDSDNRPRIPYSVADSSFKSDSRIVDSFLSILDLKNKRFTVSEVMDLLETEAVRERFGIMETDLADIRIWVSNTRIRWGIDAAFRKRLDLPEFEDNSWRAGLKRLILGYALPGHGELMFKGILPYDDIEGQKADLLGRFIEFLESLFESIGAICDDASTDIWITQLNGLLDRFIVTNDSTQKEVQCIRDEIEMLRVDSKTGGFSGSVAYSVIRYYFSKRFEKKGHGQGFITGGVTFCSMLPMRSIPFKIICLMGMNSDSYPRETRSPGFDLISRHPRRGDRSRRKDDRYLFLEVLLSAREKLYISFVGQSIRDNSLIEPSVLVSELMDYIESGSTVSSDQLKSILLTEHPLQPFSIRYFTGNNKNEKLSSYSREYYQAAVSSITNPAAPDLFITDDLPEPPDEFYPASISDLTRFFKNPCRYLLNERFGITLRGHPEAEEDTEPFDISWLVRYQIENDLVRRQISGDMPENFMEIIRAEGVLPYGNKGDALFNEMLNSTQSFSDETLKYLSGKTPDVIESVIDISGYRITGAIEPLYDNGAVSVRYGVIKGRDIIETWLKHLFVSSISGNRLQAESVLIGLELKNRVRVWKGYRFGYVDNPEERLEELFECCRLGLIKPLPFFPESSWAYAKATFIDNHDPLKGLQKASRVWEGNSFSGGGECLDPYYEMCFRRTDPVDDSFAELSERIYSPITEIMTPFDAGEMNG